MHSLLYTTCINFLPLSPFLDTIISPRRITANYHELVCFHCSTTFPAIHWGVDGNIIPGRADRHNGIAVDRYCFNVTESTTVTCYGEDASMTQSTSGSDAGQVFLSEG